MHVALLENYGFLLSRISSRSTMGEFVNTTCGKRPRDEMDYFTLALMRKARLAPRRSWLRRQSGELLQNRARFGGGELRRRWAHGVAKTVVAILVSHPPLICRSAL